MALFGNKKNKKKNNDTPQNFGNNADDDISIFEALDAEEDFAADIYPNQSYDDFEGQDIDADILGIDADEPSATGKKPEQKKKSNKAVPVVLGLLGVGIVGMFVFATFTGGDSGEEAPTEETQVQDEVDSSVEGSDEGVVVNEQLNVPYEGSINGAPVNGTGAILAFDYDYYVERDGAKAMEHFNPEVTSYDSAFVQSHIDKVPGGTTHKLKVTPLQVGVNYEVVLTLNIPGEEPVVYDQNFEVMQSDGQFFVKTFTSERVG